MSGVKRWASLPRRSTATGAASPSMGSPVLRTIARSTPTRFSRSARSPRCSPRCCLPTWCVRGEVAPDDPVAKFLPGSVRMPEFEGAPITLLDLATYTSGLPRMPSNFAPKDLEQSLHRLHGRAALRLPVEPQARLQAGQALTNMPISASACSAMSSSCAPARAMRSSSSRAFARRSAWTTPASRCTDFDAAASGARPQRGSRAGRELGLSGACRRRRASFDGERPVEVSADVPGTRGYAGRGRA